MLFSGCAALEFRPGATPDLGYDGPVVTGSRTLKNPRLAKKSTETSSNIRVLSAQEIATAGSPTVGRALGRLPYTRTP